MAPTARGHLSGRRAIEVWWNYLRFNGHHPLNDFNHSATIETWKMGDSVFGHYRAFLETLLLGEVGDAG